MSSGTTFTIMKKSKTSVTDAELKEIIENYNKESISENKDNKPKFYDLGAYIPEEKREKFKFDFVDSENKTTYDGVLEYSFNSYFAPVKEYFIEEFGMMAYDPSRSQMVIDRKLAEKIRSAAEYVLLGHYDGGIERIMRNGFIGPFGELSKEYSMYKYPRKDGDDSYCDFDDCPNIINRVASIMTAFLETDYPEDVLLVVSVW